MAVHTMKQKEFADLTIRPVTKTVHARFVSHGVENLIALDGNPNTAIFLGDVKIFQIKKTDQ